jgi:hypothetical protein
MVIQFLVFSAHTFVWTTYNPLQLRCRFGFDIFDEKGLGQAEQHHIRRNFGQLYVLHYAADYHSGKDRPLLLKFLQNSKSTKIPKQR